MYILFREKTPKASLSLLNDFVKMNWSHVYISTSELSNLFHLSLFFHL